MMKTTFNTNTTYRRFRWVWSGWVLGLLNQSAFAQRLEGHYQTRSDSAGGYWLVHTQPASRSTAIRFFSPQHQLLYGQTLAGRYLKLTKHNQRVLDSTLHRLVSGQLLTAQLKTDELPEDPALRHRLRQEASMGSEEGPQLGTMESLLVSPSLTRAGQLMIEATNPGRVPLGIYLQQEDGLHLYQERSCQPRYHRLLNVARIPDEWFYLTIDQPQQTLTYRVMAPTANTPYRLVLIRTVSRGQSSAAPSRPLNSLPPPVMSTAVPLTDLF